MQCSFRLHVTLMCSFSFNILIKSVLSCCCCYAMSPVHTYIHVSLQRLSATMHILT